MVGAWFVHGSCMGAPSSFGCTREVKQELREARADDVTSVLSVQMVVRQMTR